MSSRVIKNKTTELITSLLIAKGDLLTRDSSTVARLPVGTNGQVLSADSSEATGLRWINSGGGSGTWQPEELFTVNATILFTLQIGLTFTPATNSEFVTLNGQPLTSQGGSPDYTISANIITFSPSVGFITGDTLKVKYQT